MECWFCLHGYTNRCIRGKSFGSLGFDGGQAEYVRVPFADGTLQPAPSTVDDSLLIMMCDIFPTGYYGADRAIQYFESQSRELESLNAKHAMFQIQTLKDCVFVCLGCGPVGLCSILTCLTKNVGKVFAVDAVDDRLAEAEKWGAIPLKLGKDDIKAKILEATDGRGADAVIELVGSAPALKSAFELVRPAGCISSIGFHQGEVPFTALEAYSRNLKYVAISPRRRVFLKLIFAVSIWAEPQQEGSSIMPWRSWLPTQTKCESLSRTSCPFPRPQRVMRFLRSSRLERLFWCSKELIATFEETQCS